ncbi:MAG: hypothetical protein WCQ21_03590, partial [Verrucomicrobiota bacterium]
MKPEQLTAEQIIMPLGKSLLTPCQQGYAALVGQYTRGGNLDATRKAPCWRRAAAFGVMLLSTTASEFAWNHFSSPQRT